VGAGDQARRYVAALRKRLPELSAEERDRLEPWCDWVERWATRADPVTNTARIIGLDDEGDARAW
jgi:hypothetical protein